MSKSILRVGIAALVVTLVVALPGTAATPISRTSHCANFVSFSNPYLEMSTMM